ncbi:hypothetical protein BRO54_2460 [Geobacillus proteiniphilus]|uniref:Uncharacterized protein n=1 Tax=Geobacillus proteiniphilus TaxID=860353 RepID=A0A1Q5SW42_9BACL|nr:hypothetical protein BRO54_2460 [Geobacillus proteiniphilus]
MLGSVLDGRSVWRKRFFPARAARIMAGAAPVCFCHRRGVKLDFLPFICP